MYPQDTKVEGSGKAFAHLFRGMQRKGVVAVGELLTRVSATSHCVAFWPIVDDGQSELPPQEGMVMIYLPFQDEIRTLPKEKDYAARMCGGELEAMDIDGPDPVPSLDMVKSSTHSLVSNELVDAMVELIKKQSLDDRMLGKDFENAYITEFYNYLESQSLGIHWEPSSDYDTVLTEEHARIIHDTVGEQVEIIKGLLPDDVTPEKAAGKRKSVVAADPDADDTGIDWDQEYDDERIAKLTVPTLKKYCQAHGLKRTGNKSDLIQRVTDDIAERRAVAKAIKKEPGTL
jgi:hypothetical protein